MTPIPHSTTQSAQVLTAQNPLVGQPLAKNQLIVALDYPSRQPALELVEQLAGQVIWYKVGLELYLAEGRSFIEELRRQGLRVFLDLKLHDIPNTVAGAIRTAAASGAELLTVHTLGGPAMLAAAAEAVTGTGVRLLGVTVLTSMDAIQLAAIGVAQSPAAEVEVLSRMGLAAGLKGFVCSPQEVARLREITGPEATLVIPGIRPAGAAIGDQKRVATPAAALREGASFLVVGRPITQAVDPTKAADAILVEMQGVLG
jgi:orotidine-5'-phosphate decarboxylase